MKLNLNDFSVGMALSIAVGVVLAQVLSKFVTPKIS